MTVATRITGKSAGRQTRVRAPKASPRTKALPRPKKATATPKRNFKAASTTVRAKQATATTNATAALVLRGALRGFENASALSPSEGHGTSAKRALAAVANEGSRLTALPPRAAKLPYAPSKEMRSAAPHIQAVLAAAAAHGKGARWAADAFSAAVGTASLHPILAVAPVAFSNAKLLDARPTDTSNAEALARTLAARDAARTAWQNATSDVEKDTRFDLYMELSRETLRLGALDIAERAVSYKPRFASLAKVNADLRDLRNELERIQATAAWVKGVLQAITSLAAFLAIF